MEAKKQEHSNQDEDLHSLVVKHPQPVVNSCGSTGETKPPTSPNYLGTAGERVRLE